MNEYELIYVISPRVANDDVPAAIERISALVTAGGGELLSVDNWGRRRLAYPIHQHFEGTYVLTTFRLPPASAAALEAGLRLSEDVIRHLLIQGIIPQTGRRDDRDRERERDRFAAPATPAAAPAPTSGGLSSEQVAEVQAETAGLPDAITAAEARAEAANAPGAASADGGEAPAATEAAAPAEASAEPAATHAE